MDTKLRAEIKKLIYNRDLYHANYVEEFEDLEEKIRRLSIQIDKSESDVKNSISKILEVMGIK